MQCIRVNRAVCHGSGRTDKKGVHAAGTEQVAVVVMMMCRHSVVFSTKSGFSFSVLFLFFVFFSLSTF